MVGTVRKVQQDQVDLPDVASGLAAEGTLEATVNKGQPGGYAELDGTGRLPAAQLPTSVAGALNYQGLYDASGNVAPSPPGLATGWYYIISVGGTYDGDTYLPGDWTVYNGTGWDKIDNTETDHGELLGLGDDDHTQYHNDARGDARYYTKTQSDLNYQPLDSDLTAIAGLVPSNDDFVQRKAGAWVNRTPAQVKTDLDLLGTNTGDQTITLTGEVTGSGTGTFATALSATGVTPATYKSVTVDSKGRVTSGTNPTTLAGYGITDAQPLDQDLTDIAGLTPTNDDFVQRKAGAWANRTVAQVKSDLSLSGTNTGDQTITLTGDVTGSGTGSFATTLANSGVGAGTYSSVTVDAKGRVTAGSNNVLNSTSSATTLNTSENTVLSTAVAGNVLGTSGQIRVTLFGTLLNNSGANRTYTFRIKYGANTYFGDVTGNVGANATTRPFIFRATLVATGATNSSAVFGSLSIGSAAAGSVIGVGDLSLYDVVNSVFTGTGTTDSTTSQNFEVSIVSSSNTGTQTFTKTSYSVEVL